MKSSEMAALLDRAEDDLDGQVCECAGEPEDLYDDDDFWEALDLLETCKKSFEAILRYGAVGPSRRHFLNNLCDDIGHFVGGFIENDASEDDGPGVEE